jgi:hypothetical protein
VELLHAPADPPAAARSEARRAVEPEGPGGKNRANEWISADVLFALTAAGRL